MPFKARIWAALKLQLNGPREVAASTLKNHVDLLLVALNQSVTIATKSVTLPVTVVVVADRVPAHLRDAHQEEVITVEEIGRDQEVNPDISVAPHQEVVVPHQDAIHSTIVIAMMEIDAEAHLVVANKNSEVEDLDRAAWKEVPEVMSVWDVTTVVAMIVIAEVVIVMNHLLAEVAIAKSVPREAPQ